MPCNQSCRKRVPVYFEKRECWMRMLRTLCFLAISLLTVLAVVGLHLISDTEGRRQIEEDFLHFLQQANGDF